MIWQSNIGAKVADKIIYQKSCDAANQTTQTDRSEEDGKEFDDRPEKCVQFDRRYFATWGSIQWIDITCES